MNLFLPSFVLSLHPKRFSIKQERINILRVLEHHVKNKNYESFFFPALFNHGRCLLCLPHLLEFTRSKDDFVRRYYCDRRSHRFPHLLHYQRLYRRGLGISKSPTHYLARIPDELNGRHLYTDSDYITIGSILGRTEIVRNRIFINSPHLISKFHSFPRRLLFERLCHE